MAPKFGPTTPRVKTPTVKTPRPPSLLPSARIGVSAPDPKPVSTKKTKKKSSSSTRLTGKGRRSL